MDLGTIDKILELHKKMSHLKKPAGTRESPARSCLDLFLQNPDVENGTNICDHVFHLFMKQRLIYD